VNPGTAKRIDCYADLCITNGVHADHVHKITNIRADVIVPVRRGPAKRAFQRGSLFFAFASIQRVTMNSAGPPFAGCL